MPHVATQALDDWITAAQAAKILGLKPRRVRQLCEAGTLPARKVTGAWLIQKDAVYRYYREGRG